MATLRTVERERSASTAGGVGFTGLLTIVFIVLKLTGVITWSWVWVLSPIWISALIALFFTLLFLGIGAYAVRRGKI